jgi:hypothetical protein
MFPEESEKFQKIPKCIKKCKKYALESSKIFQVILESSKTR